VERVLAGDARIWDEAMLLAAIELICRKLGIRRIDYQPFERGNAHKRIRYGNPPRSL